MMQRENLDMTREQVLEARMLIDKAYELKDFIDNSTLTMINNTKNEVLKFMRSHYHNLFTFAKAWPLVQKNEKG
jgi:hypothetical protein